MRILDRLDNLPRPAAAAVGAALTTLVALLDYVTGADISFSIFYLAPIVLATWCCGQRNGLVFSLLCAVLWCAIDIWTRERFPGWFVELWNTGVRLGFFAIVTLEVAAIRGTLQRERERSRVDPLTGLCNSREFLDRLNAEVDRSRRYGRGFCLAYLDLDDFKAVNDRFGHGEGDRLLRVVGNSMTVQLRATDVAARLGGDEFAILLPETSGEAAREVVERVRTTVVQKAAREGWPAGLSAGVVSFPTPPESADAAINAADQLMYRVKREGKNQVRVLVAEA